MPVSQLTDRCWVVPGIADDAEPHFKSRAEAVAWVTDNEDGGLLAGIKPVDEACWIAVCDGPAGDCADEFDDDEGANHGGGRAETEKWITSYEWVITRDDWVLCPNCQPDCDTPDLAVVEQIPGQLALIPEETPDA
jgi:hypothetical protein